MNKQLAREYEKEIKTIVKDDLTGLYNHSFLQIVLDLEMKRAKRFGETLVLALLNINSFSSYNKQHGFERGDQLLRDIADKIRENIREIDIAARFSGDVFALILSRTEPSEAAVPLERIQNAVDSICPDTVTVSIGLSQYPGDTETKEGLIIKAQDALLHARVGGMKKIASSDDTSNAPSEEKPKILVVDDEPRNVKLLEALLVSLNYEIINALNGEEALSIVKNVDIDLVLLDVMMPGIDGYEVCRILKENERTRMIPIVMITALDLQEAKIKGIEAGADDFITKPPNKIELLTRIKTLIKVKALNNNLTNLENVLFSLANAIEAKDKYTKGHTTRVSALAEALGRKMGLTEKEVKELRLGGILHDIGKIGVPENILNKPGRLTPEEFEIIKTHPAIGFRICRPLQRTLGTALDVIQYHHEKLDGSGYPFGLKADEIPLPAKIIAVVDIYEALGSDRAYRKTLSRDTIFGILLKEVDEGKLDRTIVKYLKDMTE